MGTHPREGWEAVPIEVLAVAAAPVTADARVGRQRIGNSTARRTPPKNRSGDT